MAEDFAVGDRVVLASEYVAYGHPDPDHGPPAQIGSLGTITSLFDAAHTDSPNNVFVRWDDRAGHFPGQACVVARDCIKIHRPLPDFSDPASVNEWLEAPL